MPQSASSPHEFIRRKSGWRREFGLLDVLIFNIIGYSLGVALTTNPVFIGGFTPHANIYVVLTFGAVAAILNGITYGLFAGAMPYNGGDYVFIGRSLSPGLGFIANAGFTASQVYGLGLIVGWTFTQALSPALATFGYTAHVSSLLPLAGRLSHPDAAWALGTGMLAFVFIISLLGQRALKTFLSILFVIALAGSLAITFVLCTSTHEVFVSRFNDFMMNAVGTPNAYADVLARAQAAGLGLDQPTALLDSVKAIPLGFLIFLGFTYSVYVGGEVNEPQKTQARGILIALIFGYLVFMLTMGRYYAVVGQDFNSAIGIPQVVADSRLPAGNSMTFFAGLLTDSLPLNVFMNLGTFLWFFLLPFVMLQVCVRNVHAWARDYLLPEQVTRLSEQGFPWAAALIVLIVAEGFLAATYYFGISLIGAVGLVSVCYILAGLAGLVYPYRRVQDFEKAPSLSRRRLAGIPLLAITGAFSAAFFGYILWTSLKYPQVSGTEDNRAIVIVCATYGGAGVYYLVRKSWLREKLRRSGVDIETILGELPPD